MKLVLLFSFLAGGAGAQTLVSSDRFLLKILDRTISLQDLHFQYRNIKALSCIYSDAMVIKYFGKGYIKDLGVFLKKFPTEDEAARNYLHHNVEILKKTRHFFKILRYSEDQRAQVSTELEKLVRESAKENKCDPEVLYKDSLKTNFLNLLQTELYFRSRYGGQLKGTARSFEVIRPSIELFVESLDKQFLHEYYW